MGTGVPRGLLIRCLVALGSSLGPTAAAASSGSPSPESDVAAGTRVAGFYGEVIQVRAEKVEEPLESVGVTLSVLGDLELRERRIRTLTDVAATAPNVVIEPTIGGQNPSVTIRGVGLNAFDPANNPAVGIYIDEVPLSSLTMLSFPIFDMERVEILKGPQGTLYGRNSAGGAINFFTRRPTRERDGYVSIGAGAFDLLELEGAYGGPIGRRGSGRLSARMAGRGASFDRNRLTGDDFGDHRTWSGRGQLRFEGEAWELDLSLEASRHEGAAHPYKHFGLFDPGFVDAALEEGALPLELGLGFVTGAIAGDDILCRSVRLGNVDRSGCVDAFGFRDADPDNRSHFQTPTDGRVESATAATTLQLVVDLGGSTLSSITGYRELDREFTELNDANPFATLHFEHDNRIEQLSQELRLNGATARTDWIAGIFATADDVEVRTPVVSDEFLFTRLLIEAYQETRSLAGFGQVTVGLSDRLALVGGLRYTWEEIDYVGGTTDSNPFGTSRLLPFADPSALTFRDDRISDDDLSGKLGLELRTSDDSLLFATISKGHKSGGFFADITLSDEELVPYGPETLWAYELGWRGEVGDRARLAGSLFYYDYRDVQTFVQTDLAFKLDNIPEAEVLGADFDLRWAVSPGLDLGLGLGLLDTELGAFVGAEGPVPAGNRLANAPEVSFNALVGYRLPLAAGRFVSMQLDASYRDEAFRDAANTELIKADDYWLVNARLAWSPSSRLELALWGQNLTDEDYVEIGALIPLLGSGFRSYNEPRRWGVSLTVDL